MEPRGRSATFRILLAAALLLSWGGAAGEARPEEGPRHRAAASGWHDDTGLPGPIVQVGLEADLVDGDAPEDGDRVRVATHPFSMGVPGPAGVACGSVALAIHLRGCGHLSDRLDLPPPLLS